MKLLTIYLNIADKDLDTDGESSKTIVIIVAVVICCFAVFAAVVFVVFHRKSCKGPGKPNGK